MKSLKKYSISKEDIRKEFENCLSQLKSWNRDAPFPKRPIKLSSKLLFGMRSLGQCQTTYKKGHLDERQCVISLNRAFLSGYMSPESLKSTIMHEIVHTFQGCNNHGTNFQHWENLIQKDFGVDIGIRASKKEAREFSRANVSSAKDIAICLDCGHYWTYSRKTKHIVEFVHHDEVSFVPRFRCFKGNGSCLVIRRDGFDLTDKTNTEEPAQYKAELWLKKHVPPAGFLKGKPFIWTPERIEQEYWWLDEEEEDLATKVRVAAKAVTANYVQISLFS